MNIIRDCERIIFSEQRVKDKSQKKIINNDNFHISKLGNNVSHLYYILANAIISRIFYWWHFTY